MHLTLKKEATKPASFNFLQQQQRFDRFVEVYNTVRPHQALKGAYPADLYTPSPRVYQPPFTPDRTLRFILSKSGQIFDPFIAKVFIQAMGLYPIGTVVELDTGERAVVVKQNENHRFIHRPYVSLLGATSDTPIDLTETASGGNGFRRSIVTALYDKAAEVTKRRAFLTESNK